MGPPFPTLEKGNEKQYDWWREFEYQPMKSQRVSGRLFHLI